MPIRFKQTKTGRRRTCRELNPWAKLPRDRVDLLEEHLSVCNTNHDLLMCYYKHDHMDELSPARVKHLYKLTADFIEFCDKGHFKRIHQTREDIMDRILAYYEWNKLMWHKSPKECRFIFQKAYSDFLAVLQCRKFGIALPNDTCLLNIRTKFVKYWKAYFICKRENMTWEEYYVYKEGHLYIYPDVAVEYEFYFAKIEWCLNNTVGAVYLGCEERQRVYNQAVLADDPLLVSAWD